MTAPAKATRAETDLERVLLSWLADFLAIANLEQVGLVSKLIGDHLTGMSRHVTIAKTCLRAACERITEVRLLSHIFEYILIWQIRASPAADSQRDVVALLMSIVTVSLLQCRSDCG